MGPPQGNTHGYVDSIPPHALSTSSTTGQPVAAPSQHHRLDGGDTINNPNPNPNRLDGGEFLTDVKILLAGGHFMAIRALYTRKWTRVFLSWKLAVSLDVNFIVLSRKQRRRFVTPRGVIHCTYAVPLGFELPELQMPLHMMYALVLPPGIYDRRSPVIIGVPDSYVSSVDLMAPEPAEPPGVNLQGMEVVSDKEMARLRAWTSTLMQQSSWYVRRWKRLSLNPPSATLTASAIGRAIWPLTCTHKDLWTPTPMLSRLD